jgi:N-acetyl-1-D-myo-inositol-2-amino-2-deoxy-alpha-D-glucopyranoside deacetylase
MGRGPTDMDPCHLLGLFAHPDDETYSAGGTLALAARAGLRMHLVSATRGEAGLDLTQGAKTEDKLAAKRSLELHAACLRLGALPPTFLNLPDGQLEQVADLPATLAALIEGLTPRLIIGHGPDGAYGHRDHIALCRALDSAVERMPPDLRPRVLQAAFPPALFEPIWARMRRSPAREFLADTWPGPAQSIDLEVDIRSVADAKRAAMAAHASQLRDGDPAEFLRPGFFDQLLTKERFHLAWGRRLPTGAKDPFEDLL